MSEEDIKELESRRAYDQFLDHMDQYLIECGASPTQAKAIGRHLVWWASVLAKTHGWFTGFVALAAVASLLVLAGYISIRQLFTGVG